MTLLNKHTDLTITMVICGSSLSEWWVSPARHAALSAAGTAEQHPHSPSAALDIGPSSLVERGAFWSVMMRILWGEDMVKLFVVARSDGLMEPR